jgi:hypothetical protein
MKTLAQLTSEQVDMAWTFAKPIPNEDSNEVRQDFLGALIHRDKYNVDDPYGWIVEYILDEEFLRKHSKTGADIFCEANVRVLFVGNYEKNKNNRCYYKTPFGQLNLGILTSKIEIDEQEDNINIRAEYAMDVNYEPLAECTIRINIKPRESKDFSIQEKMNF